MIDNAMTAIENENNTLRGKLDKRFGRAQLGQGVLGELIDLISTIGFADKYNSFDLLGEVYEYFLGQFASAEGKKGGQFYTPSHVVKTLVAVLSPHSGRVYDPCCGSGGMFVQSEEFVKAHGGRVDDISIYGQESNPTTWRLAAMNLAIRGFSADLGKEPADTFARDQFPDLKFDYIMANPPFNISDWGGEKYESDPRWKFGRPPVGNANYAWLQHMLWKLRPGGQAGVVLANGSMSSNTGGEGQIREAMIRGDVVEVTREHYNLIVFAVHSFLRPTETELFGIRFCDIETKDDPRHLLMTLTGKTGYRTSASLEAAVDIFEKQRELHPNAASTDFVFMPEYVNRTTAVNTYRRIFKHFLDEAKLKTDKDGNARSPYSLRHYALQTRLRKSEGKVNICWLAENAGTSVEQLERFYLKRMEPTGERVRNIQSFGSE